MALSQRGWLLAGSGAVVVLVGLTYFVGVGPELSHNSSVRAQITAAQDTNTALAIKNHRLQIESAGLDKLMAQQAQQALALPGDTGISKFTRDISALAAANSLALTTFTIASPAITSATTETPVAATSVASPIGSLFEIPISLVLEGSTLNEVNFLHQLQTVEPRATLVNSVQLAAGEDAETLTVAMKVFLAPQAPAVAAPAVPAAAVAAPAVAK